MQGTNKTIEAVYNSIAASEEVMRDTISRTVKKQPSRPNTTIRNPSRPVVSTVDSKHTAKPRDVIQGSGIKGSKIVMDLKSEEIERLENEVKRLKESLSKAESTIKKLMRRDKEMSERLDPIKTYINLKII